MLYLLTPKQTWQTFFKWQLKKKKKKFCCLKNICSKMMIYMVKMLFWYEIPRQEVADHLLPCPAGTSHSPRLSVQRLFLVCHTANCSYGRFGQVRWTVLNTPSTAAFSQVWVSILSRYYHLKYFFPHPPLAVMESFRTGLSKRCWLHAEADG